MVEPFLLRATTSSSAPAPSASTCTHSYRSECSSQSTSTSRAIRSWYSSPRRRAPLRVMGLLTRLALDIAVHAPFYCQCEYGTHKPPPATKKHVSPECRLCVEEMTRCQKRPQACFAPTTLATLPRFAARLSRFAHSGRGA